MPFYLFIICGMAFVASMCSLLSSLDRICELQIFRVVVPSCKLWKLNLYLSVSWSLSLSLYFHSVFMLSLVLNMRCFEKLLQRKCRTFSKNNGININSCVLSSSFQCKFVYILCDLESFLMSQHNLVCSYDAKLNKIWTKSVAVNMSQFHLVNKIQIKRANVCA